ncbi:hypothetical protein MICAI_2800001 [Microcystis sp. T1-4]|nr:hypothetical protein MICAI_2800001 [Microcystis sp. T1-4]
MDRINQTEYNLVSPDEKIFTPTDERGFLPYILHPFGSSAGLTVEA